MAPVHSRGNFAAVLEPDLAHVYVMTGKERPEEYAFWCNVDDMEWNPMTDQQVSGLGTMPAKPEGTQFNLDRYQLGAQLEIEADPFGMAIEFTYEYWRDEKYGLGREMVREMARSGRNRVEVDAASLLNNAFSTSFPGFTSGEALCSTSHTSFADGEARANRPSPDIGFSVTGIQNAIIRFHNMENDRGLPMAMAPVMAMVSPTNLFAAREILGSSQKPYTTDNELNALIEEDMSWMVNHYFTSTTQWFLLAAKGVHDLWFHWRDRPIFDGFDDPYTKNAIFTSYQRHTQAWRSWRGVDGSTG